MGILMQSRTRCSLEIIHQNGKKGGQVSNHVEEEMNRCIIILISLFLRFIRFSAGSISCEKKVEVTFSLSDTKPSGTVVTTAQVIAGGETGEMRFWRSYGRTVYGGNPIVQQTLPTFFLYTTPHVAIIILVIVAALFIAVGVPLIVFSGLHHEVANTYSEIHKYQYTPNDPSVNINQGIRKFKVGNVIHSQGTRTRVMLKVNKTLKAPVYLYYTIENFFQNLRDFHDGRSTTMLAGKDQDLTQLFECRPLQSPGFMVNNGSAEVRVEVDNVLRVMKYRDYTYHPCGIAPWSMFNDTFVLYRVINPVEEGVSPLPENLEMICNTSDFSATGEPLGHSAFPNRCHKKGISWRADENVRFKPLQTAPHIWSLRYPYPNDNVYLTNGWYDGEPGHSLTDPLDYDMQVWIRAAFLPNFRKLFRIVDVDLTEGQYVMDIDEFFDVASLRGSKGFVLRTSSWIGKEGYGIGIAFLLVGCASFVLSVTFSIVFLMRLGCNNNKERSLNDPWYIFDSDGMEMRIYYEQRTKRHAVATKAKKNDDS